MEFFKILFSDYSLQMHTIKTDFAIVTANMATILSLFTSCDRFLVGSYGFSIYKILSSANKDDFASLFPIWMSVIYFFWPNCPG